VVGGIGFFGGLKKGVDASLSWHDGGATVRCRISRFLFGGAGGVVRKSLRIIRGVFERLWGTGWLTNGLISFTLLL